MKTVVPYKTKMERFQVGDLLLHLETIEDLDKTIDQICDVIAERGGQGDPFAEDLCPYFGVLWPAAQGLAQYLYQERHQIQGLSLLELGAGLALPSFVASKLGAHIHSTDFHPDVPFFMERNKRHNSVDFPFSAFNWREHHTDMGQYDWVIGSDILYESKHPDEVAKSLARHLKPGGRIVLADPGRSYLQQFVSAIQALGFKEDLLPYKVGAQDIYVLVCQK